MYNRGTYCKKSNILLSKYRKKLLRNQVYEWKTADRIESRFSSRNRPKLTFLYIFFIVFQTLISSRVYNFQFLGLIKMI